MHASQFFHKYFLIYIWVCLCVHTPTGDSYQTGMQQATKQWKITDKKRQYHIIFFNFASFCFFFFPIK